MTAKDPASTLRHQANFRDGPFSVDRDAATWHGFGGAETLSLPVFPSVSSSSSSQFFQLRHCKFHAQKERGSDEEREFEAFKRAWGPDSGTVMMQETRHVRASWAGDGPAFGCFNDGFKWTSNRICGK